MSDIYAWTQDGFIPDPDGEYVPLEEYEAIEAKLSKVRLLTLQHSALNRGKLTDVVFRSETWDALLAELATLEPRDPCTCAGDNGDGSRLVCAHCGGLRTPSTPPARDGGNG
ncbi:MAG: hypothetical protein K2R93_12255 [Gemmatimonadaceae bacterium]|nr:hypothetical protein [Gemmatimonadaceae bacterium]